MHAGLPAGRFPGAVFLVPSLSSGVPQELMLAVLGPTPGAKPVVVVMGIRRHVDHPLAADWPGRGAH